MVKGAGDPFLLHQRLGRPKGGSKRQEKKARPAGRPKGTFRDPLMLQKLVDSDEPPSWPKG
jgi:hypothetical protein